MEIIQVKDYEQLSSLAAEKIIQMVRLNKIIKLGLATGETPKGMYKYLVKDFRENGTSYHHVYTFNLDEYVGRKKEDCTSYHYFMNHHLFQHINIPSKQTFLPQGNEKEIEEECFRYEEQIKRLGGIDLQILGLGVNGHIGFNEPGTSFHSSTHVVQLTSSTREANARFFDSIEDVPKKAITMGIETIMRAKQILLLVSGAKKREPMEKLLKGEVSENFPASILKKHPNIMVIADEEAVMGIDFKEKNIRR